MSFSRHLFSTAKLRRCVLAAGCLLLGIAAPTRLLPAADITSYLPEDTLAYAVAKDLTNTDQKLLRIATLFKPDAFSLLELAKSMTKLSEGIDPHGAALLAYVDNSENPSSPIPLLLLPTSNYQDFSKTVGGDSSGEICRVRIAEVELLTARLADYALVMNVEHRQIMRQILERSPTTIAASLVSPSQKSWMDRNDLSVVLTRLGLGFFAKHDWKIGDSVSQEPSAEDVFGEDSAAAALLPREPLPLMRFAVDHFQSICVGVAIDCARQC